MTFEQSSGSPHHFFAQLAGHWTGMSKLWLEPDKLLDEAPIIGTIQIVLDGRFALFLYQTSVEGETQHGMFTFGFNTTLERYEASWLDSFHNNTANMFCVGSEREKGFSVLGTYPDPNEGPDWGWRIVLRPDNNALEMLMYNILPDGREMLAVKGSYKKSNL